MKKTVLLPALVGIVFALFLGALMSCTVQERTDRNVLPEWASENDRLALELGEQLQTLPQEEREEFKKDVVEVLDLFRRVEDTEGLIRTANRAVCAFGFTPEELNLTRTEFFGCGEPTLEVALPAIYARPPQRSLLSADSAAGWTREGMSTGAVYPEDIPYSSVGRPAEFLPGEEKKEGR